MNFTYVIFERFLEYDYLTRVEYLIKIFPEDLKPHVWNRKVVQMGTADMAKDKLKEVRHNLGAANREDLISFADVIDFDEHKIT